MVGGKARRCADHATKVGNNYSEQTKIKVLFVGQEGKAGHATCGKPEERIKDQDNEHYRKTLYTLALIMGKGKPKSFSRDDLATYDDLLKEFCLTNYYKCAIQKENIDVCRGLKHTPAMKANCYHLLDKEIEILNPDLVIMQGKFLPKDFWDRGQNAERIDGNQTEKTDTISLYRYHRKDSKPLYILYSYHPCYYQAWSGNLLDDLQKMIKSFFEDRKK